MNEVLSNLETIKKAQNCDSEIYKLQIILEEIPDKKKILEGQLESEKDSLKAAEESLKNLQLTLKNKEGELAEKEEQAKKLDGQLSQVKTNKEYDAIKHEIASIKADASLFEEEIIKTMDAVEAAHSQLEEEKKKMDQISSEYKAKIDALSQEEQAKKSEISSHEAQREEFVASLPGPVKELYQQISIRKQGIVLAPVIGDVCGVCQIGLRAQTINDVRLGEDIVTCDSCSRILYVDDPA